MVSFRDDSAGGSCTARLIGSFALTGPDGEPIAIRGKRTRALLSYLLLVPGQTALRDRLAGLFWADRGDAQARSSLRQCLHELKTALPTETDRFVTITRETVALVPEAFVCDALRLQNDLSTLPSSEAVLCVEAAGAGQLLEDIDLPDEFLDWLTLERTRFDASIGRALAEDIARSEAAGDWPVVKALANAWLWRDALNEVPMAALIRAELATGGVVNAHRHYVGFRARLEADLGVEPGPLIEAAIRQEAAGPAMPRDERAVIPFPNQTRQPAATNGEIMLAVLAFENMSSDPELGFFCDGVAEEIQCTVAHGAGIKVVARASSFQLRGTPSVVADAAAALGASHLLYGSVRRSGERVRISAELVDCHETGVLWSERFDGGLDDVFALQEDVARQVASALKIALRPSPAVPHLPPAEYEKFLRARGLLAEGDPQYDDSATEAEPLLAAVTMAAPDHAPAWEQLAIARAWILRGGRNHRPYGEARTEVVDAAERALRLDPSRAGALLALAMLEPWGAYAQRERILANALELAPYDPAVLTDMSQFCWSVGRFNAALSYAEQACELNPLMPGPRLEVAQMLTYTGNYDRAIGMHVDLWRRWPQNLGILFSLLNCSAFLGYWDAYDMAIGDIDRFDGWQGADLRATKAFAETLRSGDPQKIARRLERYTQLLESTGTIPLNLLVTLGAFGLVDEALDLAERASYDFVFDRDGNRPSAYFPGNLLGPWSRLLSSPRAVRLTGRLGLCDYWNETDRWPDCAEWVPYAFKDEARLVLAAGNKSTPVVEAMSK